MIRYDTGDTGIVEMKSSTMGEFPYLKSLYGRRLDLIYDSKGNPIQPFVLSRILKNFPDIIQWQFIQKEKNLYILKLNTPILYSEECVTELQKFLGKEACIQIEYVSEIPVLDSGKRKSVICEWNPK